MAWHIISYSPVANSQDVAVCGNCQEPYYDDEYHLCEACR